MKHILAIAAVVLFGTYFIDQQYYHGYYFRNLGSVTWQVATAFGLRR